MGKEKEKKDNKLKIALKSVHSTLIKQQKNCLHPGSNEGPYHAILGESFPRRWGDYLICTSGTLYH